MIKKLLWILLLLLPLTVTATDFKLGWDEYPYPDATMSADCGINNGMPVGVGST